MGEKIKVNNLDILRECIEKLKTVNIKEIESGEEIEFKFINIENLSLISWNKRFKKLISPQFEYIEREKYGKTFLCLNVYQCVETAKLLEEIKND
jgi:hypothetical protein